MKSAWVSPLSVLGFLVVWEAACRMQWVSPVLLTPPTQIIQAGVVLLQTPAFLQDIVFTLTVYGLSLAFAVVIGSLIGFVIGYSFTAYQVLNPFVVTINALPKIVLMPLIILWVGIGITVPSWRA